MKKQKLLALFALIALFSFTACGGEDESGPDFLNGKVYVPEAVDIELALDFVDSYCAVGEDFYILGTVEEVDGARSVLCRVPIDGSAAAELEGFSPGILDVPDSGQINISVNGLCAGEDSTMWVMERDNVFTFDSILEGRQMLFDNTDISNFFEISRYEALFGGPVSFIGDPRSDGKCGSSFSLSVAGLCMTTACKDKKGAWEFMRQLLLPHGIKSANIFYEPLSFPINREDFELLAQLSLHLEEPGHKVNMNGLYDLEYRQITQEEYDQVMALYNAVDSFYAVDSTVWAIIEEQVQPYFAGDKSLDETIDLIQGQVELYVNEQR